MKMCRIDGESGNISSYEMRVIENPSNLESDT